MFLFLVVAVGSNEFSDHKLALKVNKVNILQVFFIKSLLRVLNLLNTSYV
jgi:hypothetical protein